MLQNDFKDSPEKDGIENTPFFAKARQRFSDEKDPEHLNENLGGIMSPRVAEDITSDEKTKE